MGYRKAIEDAEKYISDHLRDELDPSDIAEHSGYSYFHFCHVFRAIEGTGLARYILKRRMGLAKELLADGKSVTFTAMETGFDTVSGFTRAFTRSYGLPPSKFRASCTERAPYTKGEIKMEPEIIRKEAFRANCVVIRPESEIDILESGGYWIGKDIPDLKASSHEEAFSKASAKIGTWMHDKGGRELYYVYGDAIDEPCCDGAESSRKVIEVPAAQYAVFPVPTAHTHEEFVANLRAIWKYIFNDWFDGSAYRFDVEKMDFEYYTAEGVSIYVPVLAK